MESDYTLLYLHHGLTSDNKPSLSWLRDAYREFDRKWVGAPGAGGSGPSSSVRLWSVLCLGGSSFHARGQSGADTGVKCKESEVGMSWA